MVVNTGIEPLEKTRINGRRLTYPGSGKEKEQSADCSFSSFSHLDSAS